MHNIEPSKEKRWPNHIELQNQNLMYDLRVRGQMSIPILHV